jgi:hypothetical protein
VHAYSPEFKASLVTESEQPGNLRGQVPLEAAEAFTA